MIKTSGETKQKIEAKMDEVFESTFATYRDLAACYEQYGDSLNQQIESVETRSKQVSDGAKSDL